MSRDRILQRIRRIQGDSTKLPDRYPDFPAIKDPIERFRQEAERVSTIVLDGRKPSSPEEQLEQVLAETGWESLYWQGQVVLERHGISFRPPAPGDDRLLFVSHHPGGRISRPLPLETIPYDRPTLAGAGVSVGSALWGVAETGTTVESTAGGWGRILPILPPVHVVLLQAADLVDHHLTLFSRLEPGLRESAQVLMTGPSRTADIEKVLILGVHGPQRLYVILTDTPTAVD